MAQSSIEWLMEKIATKDSDSFIAMSFYVAFKEEFQQAKEMHKQEIEDAFDYGFGDGFYDGRYNDDSTYIDSTDYYNKTFNK